MTPRDDRRRAKDCLAAIAAYRQRIAHGMPSAALARRAREAFLHLGGDPFRSTASLKDYDHQRYGPFLGVSDEGSAGAVIRAAAHESPKAKALGRAERTSLAIGVAIDAERLGGVGEVAVGPEEYADIWEQAVDRLLVTTNVGTRVNVRFYRRDRTVILVRGDRDAIGQAKREIAAAFKPFVETPDQRPRPALVLVDIPRYSRMTAARKRAALSALNRYVESGAAADRSAAPKGQRLGLTAWIRLGLDGKSEAIAAMDLASSAGIRTVVLDGVKRKPADAAGSFAGLLDYFPPGIVGPLLRHARESGVELRAANLPDTDTIARSIWVALTTARTMGANLGKYGCFPLTLSEIDFVVEQIQTWLPDWSAAPVLFVDQGVLRPDAVDVGRDLPRGIEAWLDTVSKHGVRVVLIDTVDKASGRGLLKKDASDTRGFLTLSQVQRIEAYARKRWIKTLWAGGFHLPDAYALGRLGVFGIYVTTAAATTIAVAGSYERDPALAGVKEPTREAVLRTKIVLEAGFLAGRLGGDLGASLDTGAKAVLDAVAGGDAKRSVTRTAELARVCEAGWRAHWASR